MPVRIVNGIAFVFADFSVGHLGCGSVDVNARSIRVSARRYCVFLSGGVLVYLAALYLYLSVFGSVNSAALGKAFRLLSDGGVLAYLSAISSRRAGASAAAASK